MLRTLRVIGILVFALLVGLSAHRIQKLYASGKLFDQYNSERKANVTLMAISVLGLGVLGFFEATHHRRRAVKRGFAPVQASEEPVDDGLDTTNIYTAPESDKSWERVRGRESRIPYKDTGTYERFWIGLLWAISIVVVAGYGSLTIACAFGWYPSFFGTAAVACGISFGMLALCFLASWGILRKQEWGLKVGYAVAILHLLYFPLGTAVGLIMIVALVGASSLVVLTPRERRRAARAKKYKNLGMA